MLYLDLRADAILRARQVADVTVAVREAVARECERFSFVDESPTQPQLTTQGAPSSLTR